MKYTQPILRRSASTHAAFCNSGSSANTGTGTFARKFCQSGNDTSEGSVVGPIAGLCVTGISAYPSMSGTACSNGPAASDAANTACTCTNGSSAASNAKSNTGCDTGGDF